MHTSQRQKRMEPSAIHWFHITLIYNRSAWLLILTCAFTAAALIRLKRARTDGASHASNQRVVYSSLPGVAAT